MWAAAFALWLLLIPSNGANTPSPEQAKLVSARQLTPTTSVTGGALTCPAALTSVGASYSDQSNAGVSGFAASGLPPGLNFASSGVISGVPTQAGVFPVTLTSSEGIPLVCAITVVSSQGTTQVTDLIVSPLTTQVVSGSFSVSGNVDSSGTIVIAPLATLNVTGNFVLSGALKFFYPANITVGGLTTLNATNSTLELTLTQFPGLRAQIPILSSAGGISGQLSNFANIPVTLSFSSKRSSARATLTCYTSTSQVTTDATVLSVVVQLTPTQCQQAGQSAALSTGAIVGIVVGSVAGGILIALGIVALVYYMRNTRTKRINTKLRKENVTTLKNLNEV